MTRVLGSILAAGLVAAPAIGDVYTQHATEKNPDPTKLFPKNGVWPNPPWTDNTSDTNPKLGSMHGLKGDRFAVGMDNVHDATKYKVFTLKFKFQGTRAPGVGSPVGGNGTTSWIGALDHVSHDGVHFEARFVFIPQPAFEYVTIYFNGNTLITDIEMSSVCTKIPAPATALGVTGAGLMAIGRRRAVGRR